MKKSFITSMLTAALLSSFTPLSTFAEETQLEPTTFEEGLNHLPESQSQFITFFADTYKDYNFVFNPKDVEVDDEGFARFENEDVDSADTFNDALVDFLSDQAYFNNYNEEEIYTETEEGLSIEDFLRQLIQESVEDHQADKVAMMHAVKDIDTLTPETVLLDQLTMEYASQANMLQFLVTQFTKGNQAAEDRYYKEASEELGIDINKDTDIKALDPEVVNDLYASEAFANSMDPEQNPDANLSAELADAQTPEEWQTALDTIYEAGFVSELSGRDLNMLANAFNNLRVLRVSYYQAIDEAVQSTKEEDDVEETNTPEATQPVEEVATEEEESDTEDN